MEEKISSGLILNQWLKYHNTTIKEVTSTYPDDVKNKTWFKYYPVTKEQYEEWVSWLRNQLIFNNKNTPINVIKNEMKYILFKFGPNIIGENENI